MPRIENDSETKSGWALELLLANAKTPPEGGVWIIV